MQFGLDRNYKAPQLFNQLLSSFRGVDYSNATLSIAANRSPNAINWLFKDGINQKRNGFSQLFYKSGKINGYWEFKDSNGNTHRILHINKEFYKITLDTTKVTGATFTRLYPGSFVPEYYEYNNWHSYITNGLRNETSYGIVRGDRLYIFAGILLVYGKWASNWELRAVRDNEDTYIPVVTTNIDYNEYQGKSTRAALEDINMMSCRRRARIISPTENEDTIDVSDNIDTSIIENSTSWKNFSGTVVPIDLTSDVKYGKVTIKILNSSNSVVETRAASFSGANSDAITFDSTSNDDKVKKFTLNRTASYPGGRVSYRYQLIVGLSNDSYIVKVYLGEQVYVYTIDARGINNDTNFEPKVKYIGGSEINSDYYTIDESNGTIEFTYFEHYNKTHTPDIEVEYSPPIRNNDYAKIDGCRFGCIFGYNSIEHLFASGNENYPNVDWHTNESFFDYNSNIPETQNLTYWSDLSYEYLGGQQSAIKSYIVLSDNTLAILKENIPHEYTLYIRSPFMAAAITYDGETVRDSEGNSYQKLYYNTVASAMGIGCISTFASSNSDGDKMFLSDTGVYGIEIAENTASAFTTQRFARNRSFYINPKLLSNVEQLKKASSIVYRGKYYLALNDAEGTVYVADKVDNKDTDYTHVYEWYCLKGIKANSWFINIDNKLGYTTDDGRVFLLNEKYYDKEIDLFESLSVDTNALDYDEENHTFGTFTTNADDLIKVKDYSKIKIINSNLYEKLCDIGGIYYDTYTHKYKVSSRVYIDYLQYYTGETIYLYDSSFNVYSCTISDLDSTDYTFSLNSGNLVVETDANLYGIAASLDEEYAMVNLEEGENDSYTFQLLARNGVDASQLLYTTQTIAGLYLLSTIALINENPIDAKWYTPIMNMGDSNYSKTLKYFTIIPERYLRGQVNMTFITREKETNVNIEGLDYLESLDNVDLDTISIDPTLFAKSFTKRYKIRNFNFLQVLFESNNTSNAALHNISLTYVVGKRNRGVK